ncbi:nucleoside 2-deoxyribosyltransferase [Vibrio phage VaK]|nr:nucleoside 2-deoxyribosyltransferase [Vibrio phage VaK]
MKQKKIYIAGPMTGLPEFNKPEFFKAEFKLRCDNYTVLNPAILPDGLQHHEYMEICLPMVRVSNAVYMLKGWEKSKGAVMEHEYAKDLGLEITYQC